MQRFWDTNRNAFVVCNNTKTQKQTEKKTIFVRDVSKFIEKETTHSLLCIITFAHDSPK